MDVDPLGDDLEAVIGRGQDRLRPPHLRWRWAYRIPWIARGNNGLYSLAISLGILLLTWAFFG